MEKNRMVRMKSLAAVCAVALWAVAAGHAQNAKQVVDAKTVLAAEGAAPDSTLEAAAVVHIAPGYHINDHKPTLDYLIPTAWTLEGTKQIDVEKITYPRGQLRKFAFSDNQLSVYEGTLTVGARLKVARRTSHGTYTLKGEFKYQACNDHACLPPTSVPVNLTLQVVRRRVALKRVHADVFDQIQFE